ncbi:MAG: hypothetical protein B7X86_01955 [Sphingobacteriales bacterium 17-39-43]|nr:MAG: hypothetical protein B7X86_01955 [Sphingobacteriales bacterium 17-39-43]
MNKSIIFQYQTKSALLIELLQYSEPIYSATHKPLKFKLIVVRIFSADLYVNSPGRFLSGLALTNQ